jgi:MoaA/NifB/PqqE/SkfB family radical SAM enzyme
MQTLAPPDYLFLQINKRCNLRCQHCEALGIATRQFPSPTTPT